MAEVFAERGQSAQSEATPPAIIPEISHVPPVTEHVLINNAPLSAEARTQNIVDYYAKALAVGRDDLLLPRYSNFDYGNADDPFQDRLVSDPLADSRVHEKANYYRQQEDKLNKIREELFDLDTEV